MTRRLVLFALCFSMPMFLFSLIGRAEDAKNELQGVWQAVSIRNGSEVAPPEAAAIMRFTFRDDALIIRGNFKDEREERCQCVVDASKSPKQFEFTPPKETKPILGIYRFRDEQLEVCIRHSKSKAGRPESFEIGDDESLVLIRFKREPDKK